MGGFVSGVVRGGMVAAIGLAVLSEVLPPPKAPVTAPVGVDPVAVEPAVPKPVVQAEPQPAPTAPPAEPAAEPATPAPAPEWSVAKAPAEPTPVDPPVVSAAPVAPVKTAPEPEAQAPVPVAEPAPAALAEPAPQASAAPEAETQAETPAEIPADPAAPLGDPGEPPLPNELPARSPLAPAPALAPVEPLAPAEPLLDQPAAPEVPVAGVTTDRLPTIAPPAAQPVTAPDQPPADPRPLARFAVSFENPESKPLYAVILIDDGSAAIDRETLAKLPLPVTIALDPATPEAAAHAAAYRAAGKEVAMLATGLPKGAKPADIATTFESNAKALPETIAVIDLPKGGFQNDRPLAGDIVPVIKDQGRGLVTFDVGLNAADQVARREAVPAAVVFRQLDAEGEGRGIIRRYLDRAAFKAAQDGRVTVLGTASAETLAALVEWSVEGRAGSVALAPLSAVLTTEN